MRVLGKGYSSRTVTSSVIEARAGGFLSRSRYAFTYDATFALDGTGSTPCR